MAPETDAALISREDAELMHRVQAGDEGAFAELMERWELPVKAVIGRIVLNASEAEELAQETFVRLWHRRDQFTAGRAVKPWVLGIAVNLARSRLRWWKRRPVVALEDWTETAGSLKPEEHGGTFALEQTERANAVRDAIAALPTDLREALVLFEYERMSYAEIAAAVGATVKAVENRIQRARKKLRGALRSKI
jgi:RNA polymerase sigma factor (sigma-70 family)